MNLVTIIFRPIITFTLVASFSIFFMYFFFIAGILTTKIRRHIIDDVDEAKHLKGYTVAAIGGLLSGLISLIAAVFL